MAERMIVEGAPFLRLILSLLELFSEIYDLRCQIATIIIIVEKKRIHNIKPRDYLGR